jgi:fatty acid desaturase
MVAIMRTDDDTPGTDAGPDPRDRPGHLDPDQLAAFGAEMDRLRDEIIAARGAHDAAYIHRIITLQRRLEAAGRLALFAGILPPAWVAGTTLLATSKILENMEIGHNVMHGQWDWMRDPEIHSTSWEWDNACPSSQWQHSHNEVHHVWTNVVGKDRDVGYGILRVSDEQPWSPVTLGQPLYAAVLAALFQWGVAMHDVEIDQLLAGRGDRAGARARLAEVGRKGGRQVLKDYVAFPALAGPFFFPVLAGNMVANLARNLWSFTIIFCGHFPDGVEQFTEADVLGEDRSAWYVRQILGSANISGGPLLDLMSGNLSYQIEHHLFPDLPSNRYAEVAPRVRELCERYGIAYTTGSLPRQFGSVVRRIVRFALP